MPYRWGTYHRYLRKVPAPTVGAYGRRDSGGTYGTPSYSFSNKSELLYGTQTKAEGASVKFTKVNESEHIYDSIKTDAQD